MKIVREGKEFELTPAEIQEAHKEFVTNWMGNTLMEDFDMEEKDAKDVAELAFVRYCEGNGETEYEAVEWAYQEWEKEQENMKSFLVECLSSHVGHQIRIVYYGTEDNIADICLECEDCSEVVLDAELYTVAEKDSTEANEDDRLWELLEDHIGKDILIDNPEAERYVLICRDNREVLLDTEEQELYARKDV